MTIKLDRFTQAYIECALWCSHDWVEENEDNPETFEGNGYTVDDISEECMTAIIEDCTAFQRDNEEMLSQAGDDSQNGHDFWLTRHGHGAGFWDRGYPSPVGRTLSDASKVYGEVNLYSKDGKIYC